MKAILRWGAACLSLLLLTSISHGYYWVSGALRTPLPHAPDTRSAGYYLLDSQGRWTGPHYYLVPPVQPFNGMLPGPTGQAIMSGWLPHKLLLSKDGLSIGNAPLLGQAQQQQQGGPGPNAVGQYPTLGTGAMQQYGMMQVPHPQPMASGPYALPAPYAGAMPYQGMQSPQPYGPKPMMWAPYPGQQGQPMAWAGSQGQPSQGFERQPNAVYWKGANGIWQVQYAAPKSGPVPFTTIPGYQPGMPMPPQMPGMAMMPPGMGMMPPGMAPNMPPMMPMPPNMHPGMGNFPGYGPMQQMDPMNRLQGPQPPHMGMEPMQAPRMDYMPPPMPRVGGSAYPVHPFTRSPRDFFMWGEAMEEERARGNRPFPVP